MTQRWCQGCGRYRESDHVHEEPPGLFDPAEASSPAPIEWPGTLTTGDTMTGPGQARKEDPDTSHLAAQMVKARATSARVLLLDAFYRHRDGDGLTDEQAATLGDVSLQSEYATRCSELRRGGLLEVTGATRRAASGAQREVSRITPAGIAVMRQRG